MNFSKKYAAIGTMLVAILTFGIVQAVASGDGTIRACVGQNNGQVHIADQ